MKSPRPVLQKILIVGGGTAGWMTAVLFAHAWRARGIEITLLESAEIGIIGVGEGSTPKMRVFFERIGVAEQDWMPLCNGTYKCGIRFPSWSTRKGYNSYFHPFLTISDDSAARAFYQNVLLRNKNLDVHAHPDAFFLPNYLAKTRRAPLPDTNSGYNADYAYHFDSNLIGNFLKEHAIKLGVQHIVDTVTAVKQGESGDISGVVTTQHGEKTADLYVDSTGFASLLLGKTLNVPFHSYQDVLFNDRAVALPTPHDADNTLPSETLSTALKYGWVWKIPLTNRFGNGYVYSSRFTTPDAAEQELRDHIGLHDENVEARHLQMRVGRTEIHWHKNCLAVGLSQGFIEPLEATALMIVQDTITTFIDNFERGDFSDRNRAAFNAHVNQLFDSIKDYIFMHYKLNSRDDTEYWIANRENEILSDSVAQILEVWDSGGDLFGELMNQASRLTYTPTSWFCILAGMGRFPRKPKKNAKKQAAAHDPKALARYCEQLLHHFPDHRQAIDSMAGC